jgi:hypothetical protein
LVIGNGGCEIDLGITQTSRAYSSRKISQSPRVNRKRASSCIDRFRGERYAPVPVRRKKHGRAEMRYPARKK